MYDPVSMYAKVRLYGVPYQHWNKRDVTTIVAGFGNLARLAPLLCKW